MWLTTEISLSVIKMMNMFGKSFSKLSVSTLWSKNVGRCYFSEMKRTIEKKLVDKFNPKHLEVINESHMHSRGPESHYKIIIVSDLFSGEDHVGKHRLVNECLSGELKNKVHALSIIAKTPEQWDKSQEVPPSPTCQGGSKRKSSQ